jgi:glutaminyl-tRNA synthetase
MSTADKVTNFIKHIIDNDVSEKKHGGAVATRFPPEPNGYLHIGHAKSICLNFGVAKDFNGTCNLRFDDTNPEKESEEYINAIKDDVQWLGFEWAELKHASDYFDELYDFAITLIKQKQAYVDSQTMEEIQNTRGTLTAAGKKSPYRDRAVKENLELFEKMKAGEFDEGSHVLRAKIDMASPNINMRDPVIYRIRKKSHLRTKDKWCIYPMYDYTHCISDSLEGITHSLCTLEFEDHRPLYDWFLSQLDVPCHPQQIEFARLSLEFTIMSKRFLNILVEKNLVSGWDDPRMPTISGLRRRGYTPSALRDFCERIGITKKDSVIEMGVLENCIREELNVNAPRAMAVINPIKVIITNYPKDQTEKLDANNHPDNSAMGTREIAFCREIYIDKDDFMLDPPKKFFRLSPGKSVRLRYAYVITCNDILKNKNGEIEEIHCTYDPDSKSGSSKNTKKIKGIIHWVSAIHSIDAEIRLYDRLYEIPSPGASSIDAINANSLHAMKNCKLETSLASADQDIRFQFERLGYFYQDSVDSKPGSLVFNRIVTLRDTWKKFTGKK